MNKDNFKTKIKQFGDLQVGDKLIGSDGQPTTITAVYDKHIPDRMFEIIMEDDQAVQASGNHLWYCETDQDEEFKKEYKRLAEVYFENHSIPEYMEDDGHFPLPILIQLFDKNIETQLFIEKVARSLGYSSFTPIISQEMMKSGTIVDTGNDLVYNYSFNDLIDFLHKMKLAILENKGYFYFGEVRTTEEIFELNKHGVNVNIPYKEDVK